VTAGARWPAVSMSDGPADNTIPAPAPSWLPLKAAAERLGLSPDGLRTRIRRGQFQAQRDNHGRWLVHTEALSKADRNKRPRTVRPDKTAADLKVQIADLEAARDGLQAECARLEADLHGARVDLAVAQKALAAAEAERDRLVCDVGTARSETAAALAKAEHRVNELSGSIRQLSETLSEALSQAKARRRR